MIPKIIHYCWFGGSPLTNEVKSYIETWQRICPSYKIIEWNEKNFNINENVYCREAYEAKMWAFVSDYVRLKVLCEYGGIYMDTDVEVCKSFDSLLTFSAVAGYESRTSILTSTIMATPRNEWIKMLLLDYNNRHFIRKDGSYDTTTNVKSITQLTRRKYNVSLDGGFKKFGNNMVILPFEYLCAKDYQTGEVKITNETYTIHHFKGSWLKREESLERDLKRSMIKKLYWIPLFEVRYWIATFISIWKVGGILQLLKRIKKKLRI